MIQIMETNILMATGIFGRCETCLKNLYHYICALNCSPKASRFISPKAIEKAPDGSKLQSFCLITFDVKLKSSRKNIFIY